MAFTAIGWDLGAALMPAVTRRPGRPQIEDELSWLKSLHFRINVCSVSTILAMIEAGFGSGNCLKGKDAKLELDFHCPDKINSGIQIRSQINKRKRGTGIVWGYQVENAP